ncbi:MAG: penicillin-binding transpeptidase domain-containing protein [Oenococcus sp.]|uniref:penicillin-binding transpeptidase domain-containing protein n=1 Tax=Oenococcus sp. TaxID=1979414 RepID=UPI0039E80714
MINKPEFQNFNKKNNRQDNRSIIPTRLNILLGLSAFLLATLVVRLAMLTLVSGNSYLAMINRTDTTVETTEAPRGLIYDSTGQLLVGNRSIPSVSFERLPQISASEIYKTAGRLSQYLALGARNVTQRQQIDYYLANARNNKRTIKNLKLSTRRLNKLSNAQVYQREVKYLVKQNFSLPASEQNSVAIYTRMMQTTNLTTGTIKSDNVSDKEISEIGERLAEFPGIRINQGWVRDYPHQQALRTVLGNLSGSNGLPETRVNTFLSQGYSRADNVGISGIEMQYEQTLRGISRQTRLTTNNQNQIVGSRVIQQGQAGHNLQLTINAKFQNDVANIIKSNILGDLSTGGYGVVMNPYTGGIYAMAGWDRNNQTGALTQNDMAVIQDPIVMGSAVKPAMVATALQAGIITPQSSTQDDQAIRLAASNPIFSYFNPSGRKIPLDARQALENSSNTYMVQLALKMNGTPYSQGMRLPVSPTIWQRMRNGFGQFGLGSRTGIDLPGETPGYRGRITGPQATSFIDEAFGQYDTYSVIQMARFASVVANGGYLVQPQVVSSVLKSGRNGTKPSVASSIRPNIQGSVHLTQAQWDVIKGGMWDVANGSSPYNTGGSLLHALTPKVAAKTGTAETFTNGQQTQNDTLIMYSPSAPFALALAFPGDKLDRFGNVQRAAAGIYNAFWQDVMPKPKQ